MIYFIILGIIIFLNIRKESILNFNSFFIVSILYFISYVIVPLFFLNTEIPYDYNKHWVDLFTYNFLYSNKIIEIAFFALIGYLLFSMGYRLINFKKKELFIPNSAQNKKLINASIILLFFGVSSFLIYLSSLGSIVQGYLSNNRMLFEDDKVEITSNVSYLRMFSKLIISSTYLLWGLSKDNKNNKTVKALLYIGIFSSISYLFYSSGRLSIIMFFFTFLLAEFIRINKISFPKIGLITSFAIFVTLFGKSLFRIFIYDNSLERSFERMAESSSSLTPLFDFLGEFSFPLYGFSNAIETNSEWLLFKDAIFWFTYIFPASLFPTIENTSLQNTRNLIGNYVTSANYPSDILTYGYLNMGIFGVIITPILFGIICKWVDSFKRKGYSNVSTIFTIAFAFSISFRVLYFDAKHFFKGSFYLLSVIVLVYLITRKRK